MASATDGWARGLKYTMDKLFKWIFLAVVVFGGYHFYVLLYETSQTLKVSVSRANENLAIVLENTNRVIAEFSKQAGDAHSKALEIVQKADRNRAFGNSILDKIEATDCEVGKKAWIMRWELKGKISCRQWAAQARQEVRFMSFDTYNESEMIEHLSKTLLGGDWYIQLPEKKPIPLRKWIEENIKNS